MAQAIKKTSQITATNGAIIDSLDSDSDTDAPSIKQIKEILKGMVFYNSSPEGGVQLCNYDQWVAAGKPAMPD